MAINKDTKGFGVVGYGRNMDVEEPFIASDEKAKGYRSNNAKKKNTKK